MCRNLKKRGVFLSGEGINFSYQRQIVSSINCRRSNFISTYRVVLLGNFGKLLRDDICVRGYSINRYRFGTSGYTGTRNRVCYCNLNSSPLISTRFTDFPTLRTDNLCNGLSNTAFLHQTKNL